MPRSAARLVLALAALTGCATEQRASAPPAALPLPPAAAHAALSLDAIRRDARDILATIVSMDTSAGKGQVPKEAAYLAERFRRAGFPADDVHVLPLGETASLVVRYRGSGTGGRPIALLAHMDVVPAKRQDWQWDPFTLVEEKGYFFGRGTEDIKGEVAVLTETLLRLKGEGFVPTRDLVLAFSGDEETQQHTALDQVQRHRDLVDAEFALNGDGGGGKLAEDGRPVSYVIQGAEKTSATYSLTVKNPGGHSSMPRSDNAIYELADALLAVRAFHFPVQWNDWTLGNFKAESVVAPGPLGEAMKRFVASPGDAAAADEIAKNPSYVGLVRTTCVATMLQGGHAENALPQSATATVNCRIFPGTRAADVKDTLQKVVGNHVEIAIEDGGVPADASPMRPDVIAAVTHAVHALHPGVVVSGAMAPYATDGAVFRGAGIPTYGASGIFLKESDDFAHGQNERIGVDAFYGSLSYWYALIHELAGAR
jgi:acetylornithine deacetylase/succinyl-diaminopimelate desuccinylase-like protein